jgi:cleavage and polyadenylation specificity factor subunit 1
VVHICCRSGMWTVFYPDGSRADSDHRFAILSHNDSSRLLAIGDGLDEVTGEIFTAGATLVAGNIYGNSRIVQVYATGVRLLTGTTEKGPENAEVLSSM